jgi:hypothetical protein
MAENQPASSSPAAKPTQSAAPAAGKPQERKGGANPTGGVAAELEASFKNRTEVPGHPGIDARLDNRQGRFRPPLDEWPAKPQQVDGPDVAGQLEHTRKTLAELTEEVGDVQGQYSIGSHGLSQDKSLREGRPVEGPDEG